MDRCHYVKVGRDRVHIPGCWGGVMGGASGCYCNAQAQRARREKFKDDKIAELEARLAKLETKS